MDDDMPIQEADERPRARSRSPRREGDDHRGHRRSHRHRRHHNDATDDIQEEHDERNPADEDGAFGDIPHVAEVPTEGSPIGAPETAAEEEEVALPTAPEGTYIYPDRPLGMVGPREGALMQRLGLQRFPFELAMFVALGLTRHADLQRVDSLDDVDMEEGGSALMTRLMCMCCRGAVIVPSGSVGKAIVDGEHLWWGSGYHSLPACGSEFVGCATLGVPNEAVLHGPLGILVVSAGSFGLFTIQGEVILAPPGIYHWSSPAVTFDRCVTVTPPRTALGPFTLATIAHGSVGVSYEGGALRLLLPSGDRGVFFLHDPSWTLAAIMSYAVQADTLESMPVTTRDHVDMVLTLSVQWRMTDAYLAVQSGCESMEALRTRVRYYVVATVAAAIADCRIGGARKNRTVEAAANADAQEDDGGLLQSAESRVHLDTLRSTCVTMGVEMMDIGVIQRSVVSAEVRTQLAHEAIMGIKANAERATFDAAAYGAVTAARAAAVADKLSADARAHAIVVQSKADCQAIEGLAVAHSRAAEFLGSSDSTATRLALTHRLAKSLEGTNMTILSGNPTSLPYLLTARATAAAIGN